MRGVLLCTIALSGCTLLTESSVRNRADLDQDGIPADLDCDDRSNLLFVRQGAAVQTLDDVVTASSCDLQCDTTTTCRLDNIALLDFSNCPDPARPNRVLAFGESVLVLPFDPQGASRARITVDADLDADPNILYALTPDGSRAQAPEIVLMGNRGSACTVEACVLGFPLRESLDEVPLGAESTGPAILDLNDLENDPWYVVLSGAPDAEFDLQVECFE